VTSGALPSSNLLGSTLTPHLFLFLHSCGSMTHKLKDCLERPRSKTAKYTNKNIAADDKIQEIHFANYDSKRDRWNGYDSKDYAKVSDRYEVLENMRRELKKKEQVRFSPLHPNWTQIGRWPHQDIVE
jgi:hypothetical protein